MTVLLSLFQTEAAEARKAPSAASLAVSDVKNYSSYIPGPRARVGEIVARLQRRLRSSLRARRRLVLGLCGAFLAVYTLKRVGRMCGSRRSPRAAQHPETTPASARGKSRWWDFLPAWLRGALAAPLGASASYQAGEDEDDVNFVDASESAFRMFQRRVERTHEAPLLRVLSELEGLGERWKRRASHPAPTGKGNHEGDGTMDAVLTSLLSEEESEEALRALLAEKAVEADELLTRYVVQLDMAPVGDSIELRKERKASIVAASALAKRIEAWMHLQSRQQQ
ncbi:uncharacterized protein Tco025E_02451 [Trypanosoma conorhini]|uniref:Uncharacterized protein n=1 Tax=Trypanosoma conorhini TaxID=83891 RepID=A0A3R7PSD1_9TRYP|nr:uncharacterized protein Tco025E_02451 [Trypanosoma conorhini]RNF24481.1 hypothetical protein Tco025E_02451 [Trypanosoma conorhini]